MVIDTSVLLAIVMLEPEAERFIRVISSAPRRLVSVATVLEAGIVLQSRGGDEGARDLDLLLFKLKLEIVAVTEYHASIARRAYRIYGKGQGHRAGLNYGDCFTYALAKDMGDSVLFKGDDFVHTDVEPVSY